MALVFAKQNVICLELDFNEICMANACIELKGIHVYIEHVEQMIQNP